MTLDQRLAEHLTGDQLLRLRCCEIATQAEVAANVVYHYVMTGELPPAPTAKDAADQPSS